MSNPPQNLDQLRALPAGADRIRAAGEYIAGGEKKIAEARRLRDEDVRALARELGPTKAAAACGLTVHNVKSIARGAR